jgi:hypothetical protein
MQDTPSSLKYYISQCCKSNYNLKCNFNRLPISTQLWQILGFSPLQTCEVTTAVETKLMSVNRRIIQINLYPRSTPDYVDASDFEIPLQEQPLNFKNVSMCYVCI